MSSQIAYDLTEEFGVPTVQVRMDPFAYQRPRVTKNGTYTPASYRSARDYFRTEFKGWMEECGIEMVADGPVSVAMSFCEAVPKSRRRKGLVLQYRSVKPDLDNYIKGVLDALTGVAFKDDGQVAEISAAKHEADPGADDESHAFADAQLGIVVSIWPMEQVLEKV